MQRLISVAFLAALAPAAAALDDSALVQAAALVRDGHFEAKTEGTAVLEAAEGEEEESTHSDLTKYGDILNLTVRLAYGPEVSFGFRSAMRLQVLMHSLCAKLGLKLSSASFTHGGRELDPRSTAAAFGIAEGDAIEISTAALEHRRAELQQRMAREERQRERDEEAARKAAVRDAKRRKVAIRVARTLAEQKKKHTNRMSDMITLKFVDPLGHQNVSMDVKRNNWLEGYMGLVAKRMGFNRTKTRFLFRDRKGLFGEIKPHNSVRTLGLKDEEHIVVRTLRKM